MSPQASIESNHPGLGPSPRCPDLPQNQGERRGYRVERFVAAGTAAAPKFEQEFEGPGTHIILHELNGSDTIMIRLDSKLNPWVEMEEGDTIVREFNKFWVRSQSRLLDTPASNLTSGPTEATFYVSSGPLILRSPKKYGLRDGFFTTGDTASDVGIDGFGNFATQYGLTIRPAFLKYGGTLIVSNRDTANSIFLYMGEPGAFSSGAGVYPDELTSLRVLPDTTISLQVENRITNLFHPSLSGTKRTLVVACSTGLTADFALTVSRLNFDFLDPETVGASGAPVLGAF